MKRGPKPQGGNTAKAIPGIPTVPKHLDKVAKDRFKRITDLMGQMGTLSLADADVIELYCVTYSRWREATEMYAEKQTDGWWKIATQAERQMAVLLNSLGLTPAARPKINVDKIEKVDPKWGDLD